MWEDVRLTLIVTVIYKFCCRYHFPNCKKHLFPLVVTGIEYSVENSGRFQIEVIVPDGVHKDLVHEPKLTFGEFFNVCGGVLSLWIAGSIFDLMSFIIDKISRLYSFFKHN